MTLLGIDTIEFGVDVENYDKNFEKILAELCLSKEKAQENFGKSIFNMGDINFIIKGKGQGIYAYKLECNEFHICFMSKSIENTSPIYVRFISSFLWEYGYKKAFEIFLNWFIDTFHINIIGNKISRLDICFDTDEIEFLDSDVNSFFSKARKKEVCYPNVNNCVDNVNFKGKSFTGFVIGKGSPLSCRIYNKTIEILTSYKEWFKDIWLENNWNMNTVWRVEFQIRRKILKEFQVFTVEDSFRNMGNIWTYLTQNWLTLRIVTKDKNVSRYTIDNRWIKVQTANNYYNSTVAIRKKIKRGNLDKLLDQCSGIFVTIGALKNEEKTSDVYFTILEHIKEKNKKRNTTFKQEVAKRQNKYIKENDS